MLNYAFKNKPVPNVEQIYLTNYHSKDVLKWIVSRL